MYTRFTLGKNERLKSRKLIGQLFKEGEQFFVFPFRIYFLFTSSSLMPLQAGFTVSSKGFKKAVDRNRIKRLTREGYRLQKNELENLLKQKNNSLALFFIYTGKEMPDFNLVKEKIAIILQRIITLINETYPAGT